MDKGIIIGAESELIIRLNLPFVMFRQATSVSCFFYTFMRILWTNGTIQSHLFLHHVLRYHLESGQGQEAVQLAAHYQHLVFFAHALEILLHTIVESEISTGSEGDGSMKTVLPAVIRFLDHFDVALDVVVGCARKTEVTSWRRLFDVVGSPQYLFEVRNMEYLSRPLCSLVTP